LLQAWKTTEYFTPCAPLVSGGGRERRQRRRLRELRGWDRLEAHRSGHNVLAQPALHSGIPFFQRAQTGADDLTGRSVSPGAHQPVNEAPCSLGKLTVLFSQRVAGMDIAPQEKSSTSMKDSY